MRERKGRIDRVEEQLGKLQRGRLAFGKIGPQLRQELLRELFFRFHPAMNLPAAKVAAAAIAPMSTVSRPLRKAGRPVIRVLSAPATKSAASVNPIDNSNAAVTGSGSAYGSTGKAAPKA